MNSLLISSYSRKHFNRRHISDYPLQVQQIQLYGFINACNWLAAESHLACETTSSSQTEFAGESIK